MDSKIRTTVSLKPSTYEYLKKCCGTGQGLSEAIEEIVQEKRLLKPIEMRIDSTLNRFIEIANVQKPRA